FDSRPDVVERVRSLVSSSDLDGVAYAQRAMAARPDSFEVLREVEVPALVVVGDEDGLSPVSDAEAMVAALPDASLAVLPGSGHLSALEVPDAFFTALSDFLSEL